MASGLLILCLLRRCCERCAGRWRVCGGKCFSTLSNSDFIELVTTTNDDDPRAYERGKLLEMPTEPRFA